ncbi:MAG: bifunctional riboflavin kinase/FAD synthetase [Planctomycetia bacterium]
MQPVAPPIVFPPAGRWSPATSACVATIGNFDGVHVGHAAIVRRLVEMAGRLGLPAVVMTFDPHPAAILRPAAAPPPLTTPIRRAELLLELGVDTVLVQPVDERFVAIGAEDFYTKLLRERLAVRGLVEGIDFHFGSGRRGTVGMLADLCRADGVELAVVGPVELAGEAVSSSRLRRLISAGGVAEANRMLTAPYRCTGRVIEGAKRGRTLGFPTANLTAIATLMPGQGVYAARVTGAEGHGSWPAAVHVGANVSFGETAVSVEAHLVGFDGDLYGHTLHVDFLERLRETRRFASVTELTEQLVDDVKRARAVSGQPADSSTPRSRHAT